LSHAVAQSIKRLKASGKVRSYLEAGSAESMYLRLIEMSNFLKYITPT
jgi:hypothetical protein